ncbi:MAG: lipoyl(octanoyl) transferase LipB [Anaerolineae bacterium]|nr:lipoyl(octanoyl) transferase LipB [Anaerolineae bacterium]
MDRRRRGALWRLGRVEYEDGQLLMDRMVAARKAGVVPDSLFLLEHPHTITLGRRAQHHHVLLNEAASARLGVGIFETGRGGDVTYHGPGQVVGYPILDLKPDRQDAHAYVRDLEEVMIRALGDFGIQAGRVPGLTGVWVGDEKIAAIGVRVTTRTVTKHGFAINLNTDLSYFDGIIPCGIRDKGVTSLSRLQGTPVSMQAFSAALIAHFGQIFDHAMKF